MKRHILECPPNCYVDSLPGTAHTANAFMLAITVTGAALGNRNRAFQRIDNVGGTDVLRRSRQAEST